jgi:hypothetical protein
MTTDDQIRKILNEEDIERLRNRFLCTLKDMDGGGNRFFNFAKFMNKWDLVDTIFPSNARSYS